MKAMNKEQRMKLMKHNLDWDVLADRTSKAENKVAEKEDVTSTSKGTKYDGGKPKIALIPYVALEEEGKAFLHGEIKYGKHNYKQGMEALRLASAAQRHIGLWLSGIEIDADSGAHHLGCARANLAMIMELQKIGKLDDDRR